MSLAPCGTVSAYQRHLRRAERPCEACLKANSEYQSAYRAKNARIRDQRRLYAAAYSRAAANLIEAHRDEFMALLSAEREKAS